MKSDLISVIVLVCNSETYIKKCITSILKQTYQNLEIIIVNNKSNDNSMKIVKRICSKENRMTIIGDCKQPIIDGYKASNGKFVMYVDSDDFLEKDMIETMYKHILQYKTDVVSCQYKIMKNNTIDTPKNILNRNVIMDLDHLEPQFFDLLYKTFHCHPIWKQLIRRSKMKNLSRIKQEFTYGENLICNLKIYKEMKSILFIPDELYIYNVDNEQNLEVKDEKVIKKQLEDAIFIYYELYQSIKDFGVKDKKYYKKMVAAKMFYYFMIFASHLIFYSKEKKLDIIYYLNTLSEDKRIKELRKVIEEEDINLLYEDMKCSKKMDIKGCKFIIHDQIPELYQYDKWLYNFSKKIFQIVKK